MTAITSKTFHHGPVLHVPRGARVAAEVFFAGLRLMRHLFTVAPAAQRSDRYTEAEAVRSMARDWEKSDPGFAADLYAAAARHEGVADRS